MSLPSLVGRLGLAFALVGALHGCSDHSSLGDAGVDAGAVTDLGRRDAPAATDDASDAATAATPDRRRVPVGATFYLPADIDWSLASAPAGNLNAVFRDPGAARAAFVAHLAGDYRFASTTGASVALTVVDPSTLAFHNLDYFPTRAVAATADLVLVASVLRPEVVAVNPATLAVAFAIPVGPWPVAIAPVAPRAALLVAARGEDALTVVDPATRRPVRSVWVGDEVSNVAVTPDGATAIALLPNDRQAVFIRTADWSELGRVDVGSDPHHLAVRGDGSAVFVAGRRTGLGATTEAGDPAGPDVVEIAVATRTITRTIHHAGTTLGGIALGPDGNSLYVATLRSDPTASLRSEFAPHFQHTLVRYDVTAGSAIRELAAVDIGRSQPPPLAPDAGAPDDGGAATGELDARRPVGLQWIGVRDGSLWVVSEAGDLALRFDANTLVEQERFDVPGRPRAGAFAADGSVLVFGHQSQQLTVIRASGGAGAARSSAPLTTDPRPAAVVVGQSYFTGPGKRADLGDGAVVAGDLWSCSSCHADGLTDRLAWAVGPDASYRALTPALTLLDGAWPLGWQGSTSGLASAAYTMHGKVGVLQPTQDQVDGLAAYLGSIAAPPAANSLTDRDGSLSAEAQRGAAHFQAQCASCHAGPLSTSRERVAVDPVGGPFADIASLVGAARHGAWLRTGAQQSLAGAVGASVDGVGASLDATQRAELVRYVAELTGRDFFVLTELPHQSELLPTTSTVTLVFSQPVLDRADNLARVQINDPSGRSLAVRAAVDGRRLTLTPTAPLLFASDYHVVVGAGLESELEAHTAQPREFVFHTVTQPSLRASGTYTLTYSSALSGAAPATLSLVLSSDGGGLLSVVAAFPNAPLTWRGSGSISGRRLHLPPMPLPAGATFVDATSGFDGDLDDADADGLADLVAAGTSDGGVRGYTMAGAGFEARDLPWGLALTP